MTPDIIIDFTGPAAAPVVQPAPAAAEIQAERKRVAAIKRVNRGPRIAKGFRRG